MKARAFPSASVNIRLLRREVEYLLSASFLSQSQRNALDHHLKWLSPDRAKLTLSHTVTESFRAALTDQLAKSGFDEQYETNYEGTLLEDLIDRFYAG